VLPPRNGGLTVGVDLGGSFWPLLKLDRVVWKVSLDIKLITKALALVEFGNQG